MHTNEGRPRKDRRGFDLISVIGIFRRGGHWCPAPPSTLVTAMIYNLGSNTRSEFSAFPGA